MPFSLGQAHVAEDEPDVWDQPGSDTGLLALQAGAVLRDLDADRLLTAHLALFDARHVHGEHISDETVVRRVLSEAGADPEPIVRGISSGRALATVRSEHEGVARSHGVWGVPTFVVSDRAVLVRLMSLPADGDDARRSVEQIVTMALDWPQLNEFKHTTVAR